MPTHDLDYLALFAKQYPTILAASAEIINLRANLHLPKGTEHFLSDVHGEYQAFSHVLRSGSGSIKRKIDQLFSQGLSADQRCELANLIYYPQRKLPLLLKSIPTEEQAQWLHQVLLQLVALCREVSSKYSRPALRSALPAEFAFIIEELLYEQESIDNRLDYYESILHSIIETGSAREFIIALSELIQRLAIAHLHIIGDIYDRSPGAHAIMDLLQDYHSVDIQWGNHDIVWMGAAAGSEACIANVIRLSLRYANLETIENGYALSLMPLASFAMQVYRDDPCERFRPRLEDNAEFTEPELRLMAQMHKAIAVIQWKLESQVILRRPHYRMQDRLLLDKMDLERGSVCLGEQNYPLLDTRFPTLDPQHPYDLSEQERNVIEKLKLSFLNSQRLQSHLRFLLARGSMYLIYNGNLLYHGCIPMQADGSFAIFEEEDGQQYTARTFMDHLDKLVRQGCLADQPELKQRGLDAMWYLWGGAQSPIFGKEKMATFERYLIADRTTHNEQKNSYYAFRDHQETAHRILTAFDLNPNSAHIINGHVPVKVKKGESPIKAGGRLLVIDGGFAQAYQSQTGIAGYTLVFNSYGLMLAAHEPFRSTQYFIESTQDLHPKTTLLETRQERMRVRDTDQGRQIHERIQTLQALLDAYRDGRIKEAL